MTDFQNKTWKEIGEALTRGVVVILPVGSTEAHGPHLPLSTDVIISEVYNITGPPPPVPFWEFSTS